MIKKRLYCTHTSNRMVPCLCLAWHKVSFGTAPKFIPPRSSYAFLFASRVHILDPTCTSLANARGHPIDGANCPLVFIFTAGFFNILQVRKAESKRCMWYGCKRCRPGCNWKGDIIEPCYSVEGSQKAPCGRGENDCKIRGNDGNDEFSRSSFRSGEVKIHICGLREDGIVGAMQSTKYWDDHRTLVVERVSARYTNFSRYNAPNYGCWAYSPCCSYNPLLLWY